MHRQGCPLKNVEPPTEQDGQDLAIMYRAVNNEMVRTRHAIDEGHHSQPINLLQV